MQHKPFMIFFLFFILFSLSGCWDSAELQDLSIISGIGIDKGSDDVENRYQTTVQIINPSQVAGGQQGSKVQASPVTTYTSTGSTISESLRKISHEAPSELFFPHIQVMLIGEEIAKEGIMEIFDVIERDSHFRVLFPVLIVKGQTAENALKITTPLIAIPSQKVLQSLQSAEKIWGEYPSTRADQAIAKLGEGSLAITGIQIIGDVENGNKTTNIQQVSEKSKLEIIGLSVIKNGKLEKWMEGDSARGFMWINDQISRTVISLDCKKRKDALAIEVARAQSDIKVQIKNEKPVIFIDIEAEGSVLETQCPIELDKGNIIEKMEEQLAKEIKEEVFSTIKATQEEKSDLFGFGEYVNIEDKAYWKKNKNKWENEIFPETEININVHAAIRRSGMRSKSYIK
ncbi:hypothetical protein WQ54_00505 [Bacillus sp. SA1-12]|uniref:Ger(x)C family spore germination protein n=1 Tax=Bacillus sp. SA1-12 TaxID=1455638 RepID=UPI0006267CA6|nr:Ger(x)C family spore germination protein [Bacillus sp. SA1-12]KKI94059.1 hypothetical protein WQ54_00505 [Bacillus sp. SA1-12]